MRYFCAYVLISIIILVGGSGGISIHHESTECYCAEECAVQLKVSLVWLLVLLLHTGSFFRANLLSK